MQKKSTDILYCNLSDGERRHGRITAYFMFFLGVSGTCYFVSVGLRKGDLFLMVMCSVLVLVGCIVVGHRLLMLEVTIFASGVLMPTGGRRRFLPFSKIREIKLNATCEDFSYDVEIHTLDGEVELISKLGLRNSRRFYGVLQEELKGRVSIVP